MEGIHRYPKLPVVGWLGDIYDGWYVYILTVFSISTSFGQESFVFRVSAHGNSDCLSFRHL